MILFVQAYAGRSAYGDKMFKFRDGRYVDLYSEDVNQDLPAKEFAGRSVACLDRDGDGTYGFVVATYSSGSVGRFALVEMDKENSQGDTIKLKNAAGKIELRSNFILLLDSEIKLDWTLWWEDKGQNQSH